MSISKPVTANLLAAKHTDDGSGPPQYVNQQVLAAKHTDDGRVSLIHAASEADRRTPEKIRFQSLEDESVHNIHDASEADWRTSEKIRF